MCCLESNWTPEVRTSNHSVSGLQRILIHIPKDRNCEVCKKSKITRTLCRKRSGNQVLCAENFGDVTTADHDVLSEGCESRNNHPCAVVVQDLATQWLQSYPCKTKSFQETDKSLQKVSRDSQAESQSCRQFFGVWQSFCNSVAIRLGRKVVG